MIRLLLHVASFCAVYLHNGNKGLVDPVAFGPAAFDFDPRSVNLVVLHICMYREVQLDFTPEMEVFSTV